MQDGDVLSTHADTSLLSSDLGYKPSIDVKDGIARFVDWYLSFYC